MSKPVSSSTSRTTPSWMVSSSSSTPPGGSHRPLSRRRTASSRPEASATAAATLTECMGLASDTAVLSTRTLDADPAAVRRRTEPASSGFPFVQVAFGDPDRQQDDDGASDQVPAQPLADHHDAQHHGHDRGEV